MAKSISKPSAKPAVKAAKKVEKPLSEMVIKEIMSQKSVDREQAIEILKNPTTGRTKR